jgi:transcriptional coactivator HFI1/ADA1
LAVESGEFPDVSNIEARMLPFCYEAGLAAGHAPDAAQFMSIATETFIKEVLSSIFSRTRSNPPGDSGNAGFGPSNTWIQTHKYRRQLAREEEAFQRGEVTRDKTGLLPVEAKAAGERGPLGIADLRLALEMGDCGLANFPIISNSVIYDYREGELENWDDYTYVDGRDRITDLEGDVEMGGVNGTAKAPELLTNGIGHSDQMDIDNDMWWEGTETTDGDFLNGVLDSCLAVG